MKFDPKDFLEHYKHSISGKLYKQLKKNNIFIIEQILHLNPNEFILFKGVGLKTVRELIKFQKSIMLSMKNHPNDNMLSSSTSRTFKSKALNRSIDDCSLNILPKNIEIIIMNSKMLSLDIIEAIIKDYFALKPDFIRDRNIVFKRFGIDSKAMYTLEELATYYTVTRERIRQIQQKHIDTLKTLFTSNYLFKLRCEISKDALDYISSFIDMFINSNIINLSKIKRMLCNKYNMELIPSKIPLLKMVLNIYGYECYEIRGETIFFNENIISKNMLVLISECIYDNLMTRIIPTIEFDLILAIKKRVKDVSLNENMIISIIKELPNIEEGKSQIGEKTFEVIIDILKTTSDRAYAILYKNQKVMHYSEIDMEIRRLFLKRDSNFKKNIRCGHRLSNDKRFSSYGKSGYWGLSEWKLSTKNIIEIISDSFLELNKPLNIDEIFKYVYDKRSIVTKSSIYSLLYDGSFIKLDDGKYIPANWSDKYKNLIRKNINGIQSINFKEKLIKYYQLKNTDTIKWNDTKQDLQKIYNLKEGSIYNRLSNSNYIKKIVIDRKCYFKLELEYEKDKPQAQLSKRQIILDESLKIIRGSEKNQLLLRELIKILSKKYPKGSIYSAIKTDNRIEFINSGNQKFVKLRKIDEDDQNFHNQAIMKGETKNREFKSSLYWDYKLNKKNNDLSYEVLKTLVAFLNSEGGDLYIGVNDKKRIIGLKNDLNLFNNSCDIFLQTIDNLIHTRIGAEINHYLKIRILEIETEIICIISTSPSSSPVYLKSNEHTLFYIRSSSSTRQLNTQATVSYIQKHWNN